MQEVTFDLQVITPLFLAGADGEYSKIPSRSQIPGQTDEFWDLFAEIRAPSFRGILRYWLRAAVGGLIDLDTISLEDIVRFEQSIFGSTDRASAVNIRLSQVETRPDKFRKVGNQQDPYGRDYLFWSMASSGKGKNYKSDREYFPINTRFTLSLSEHLSGGSPQKMPYAIAAMWLFINFGSIGSRSHRGAGSLAVKKVGNNTSNLLFTEASTPQMLQQALQQGLREIRTLYVAHLRYLHSLPGFIQGVPLTQAAFDCLSFPDSSRIWILTQDDGSAWSYCSDALDDIGEKLQAYRSTLPLVERASFGLPLIVRDVSDTRLKTALEKNRRASPLSLHITKLKNEQYVGIAVLFKSQVSPIQDLPNLDYGIIENWVQREFTDKGALEVKL